VQLDGDPIRSGLMLAFAGNLCRCTGDQAMVEAARSAAETMRRP
jgi:xanthine dehydrogenase iron-sulfur cluster and FAD-binding subunit A